MVASFWLVNAMSGDNVFTVQSGSVYRAFFDGESLGDVLALELGPHYCCGMLAVTAQSIETGEIGIVCQSALIPADLCATGWSRA